MSHGKIGSGVLTEQGEEGSTLATLGRNPEFQQKARLSAGLLMLLLASTTIASAQNAAKKPEPAAVSPAVATQAQPPVPPAGAGVDAARYVIGSEDTLQVTVWKEPTLSGTIPVRPDGRISLVLVGDLQAAGKTPMQLSDDITVKLKKYIQDPNVSVVVMSVNSQKIFLVGEVGHVGPVMMSAGMTPLQAIAAGGGLSPYANAKKIYILRNEAGKQSKIPFNYKQALKGEAQGPELRPGDTIVVP